MNSSQAEAMKTCFGILAIMSREDTNKLIIARDGMEIILNAMTVHVDRTDVQESGCDLLWSLAFNSSAVKDIIAKHGGSVVLVRALKRHSRSADFLKSACGALSNMCQCKLNQEGVSSQGGLQPLVGSIHVHQTNAKLLPFIFDAIASIIVNNEENARTVSSLGIVPVVVASLSRHKTGMEVVKSGCHTLAILSDVKGQASKIAFAGGVPIILSLLDTHPLYSDLHRVAAVVLLRMLQESAHVGREITCHEGVRILLNSLEKGGAQQDTVAAVTHILYTVTNPSSPAASAIESQLWLPAPAKAEVESSPSAAVRKSSLHSLYSEGGANSSGNNLTALLSSTSGTAGGINNGSVTALGGVVMILGQYSQRRDVVRAACRLINNLSGYPNVVTSLDRLGILDRVCECASIHRETKDVIETTTSLLKIVHKRTMPVLQTGSPPCVQGLLHVLRCKLADEDATTACIDAMTRLIETTHKLAIPPEQRRELEDSRMIDGKIWEHSAMTTALALLHQVLETESAAEHAIVTDASPKAAAAVTTAMPSGKVVWNKGTAKVVSSVLSFIETVYHTHKLGVDALMYKDTFDCLGALLRIMPFKSTDLTRRIERILPMVECMAKHPLMEKSPGLGSKKSLLSLKPPLPSNAGAQSEEGAGFMFNGVPMRRGGGAQSEDSSHTGSSAPGGSGTGSPSPLTMGRRVREFGGGTASENGSDVSSEVNSEDGAGAQGAASIAKSRSWNIGMNAAGEKGGGVAAMMYSSSGKLLPMHPLKKKTAPIAGGPAKLPAFGGNSSASPSPGSTERTGARLLDNWPNYLERLSLSPNLGGNRSYLNSSGQDASVPSRMQLAYESTSAGGRGLLSKCPTPVPYIVPPNGQGDPFEHSLTFDSDFESGNLLRAVQKGDANYDLFLRSDLHTPGHTQWFYFAVANTHPPELVKLSEQGVDVPPVRVRFNIVNFTKPDSLFNMGMRPVVYSVQDATQKSIGWVRAGSDISYYGNSFLRNNAAGEGLAYYYTLSFTMEFHNPTDTMLIAYSYPYTMSDYRSHISEILDRPGSSDIVRQFRLCQTLSGEDCDLLVVTNFADKDRERIGPVNLQATDMSGADTAAFGGSTNKTLRTNKGKQQQQQLKPALFLSCRVHPGETPASWMMKGMLEFLTSDCSQAVLLRQVFVIFIVPMLNPDGVMYGNNRCSLAGVDLNRQWKLPIKAMHPTVYHLKYFMLAQRKIRDVSMYIDLHGHSRKYNVFMYGCDDKKRPRPQVRAFPRFFSLHNVGKKYVCYADCSFTVKKGRESTARVVVAKEVNIPCSFTLEATFCGSNYGPLKHCHMNIGHMQEVGSALCDAILNFSISEGQVKDTMLVPANLRAVAQVEKAIAAEGLGGGGAAAAELSGNENGKEGNRGRSGSNSDRLALEGGVSAKRSSGGSVTGRKIAAQATERIATNFAGNSSSAQNTVEADNSYEDSAAADFDNSVENTEVDGSSNSARTGRQDVASEDIEEDAGNASCMVETAEAEEVGSSSDESGDEGSDSESMFHGGKGGGEVRSMPSTADDGRLRVSSLPISSSMGFGGQSPNSGGGMSLSVPSMSRVLVASGRQTIMTGSGGSRSLASPSATALHTLSPSGPGGSLAGRTAAGLMKSEFDSSFGFGASDAAEGIASLQLTPGNGSITGTGIGSSR